MSNFLTASLIQISLISIITLASGCEIASNDDIADVGVNQNANASKVCTQTTMFEEEEGWDFLNKDSDLFINREEDWSYPGVRARQNLVEKACAHTKATQFNDTYGRALIQTNQDELGGKRPSLMSASFAANAADTNLLIVSERVESKKDHGICDEDNPQAQKDTKSENGRVEDKAEDPHDYDNDWDRSIEEVDDNIYDLERDHHDYDNDWGLSESAGNLTA